MQGRCGKERALGTCGQIARSVRSLPRGCFLPEGLSNTVVVAGDFDGCPGKLRQRGDQSADQRGLAHAPIAAAYDYDRQQR